MMERLLAEPPLRLAVKAILKALPGRLRAKEYWDAADRPHYLTGVLYAADQAKREGRSAIAVIEFGVAEGYGLRVLEAHAAAVSALTGVRIHVYGFDSGGGMPEGTGDYRDHPDVWQAGDYKMDVVGLRRTLKPETTLVLGPIRDTALVYPVTEPVGFVAVDVDFYSSTVDTLRLLCRRDVPHLRRVAMYFDDLSAHYNHGRAGELLAIEEFNQGAKEIHIERWRGLRGRPFPDAVWHEAMYLAHDLEAISVARLTKPPARMR